MKNSSIVSKGLRLYLKITRWHVPGLCFSLVVFHTLSVSFSHTHPLACCLSHTLCLSLLHTHSLLTVMRVSKGERSCHRDSSSLRCSKKWASNQGRGGGADGRVDLDERRAREIMEGAGSASGKGERTIQGRGDLFFWVLTWRCGQIGGAPFDL